MVRCEKCRFHYYIRNDSWCDYIEDYVREESSCEHGEFPEDYFEPQTNYDRIVSKSPEEMAKELVVLSDRCPDGVDCESVPSGRECFECWLDWLKQEADKKETED